MLQRGGTFRILISVLLAVSAPFCCCNFHDWLNACASCDDHSQHATAHAHAHAEGLSHEHEHDSGRDSGRDLVLNHDLDLAAESATTHQDSHADAGGMCSHHQDNHHDQGECSCGKNHTQVLVAVKPSVMLSVPEAVAIVNWILIYYLDPLARETRVAYEILGRRQDPPLLYCGFTARSLYRTIAMA